MVYNNEKAAVLPEVLPQKVFESWGDNIRMSLFTCRQDKGWTVDEAAGISHLTRDEVEDLEILAQPVKTAKLLQLVRIYGASEEAKIISLINNLA